MSRDIKFKTTILSAVLCGALGLAFIGSQLVNIENEMNNHSIELSSLEKETGNLLPEDYESAYAIEESNQSTFSPFNQGKISNDISSHLAKNESGELLYFGFSQGASASLKETTNDYGFINENGYLENGELDIEFFNEKFNEYYAISDAVSIGDLIDKYKLVISEKDSWLESNWYSYELSGNYNYSFDLKLDPDGDGVQAYRYDHGTLIEETGDIDEYNSAWLGTISDGVFIPVDGKDPGNTYAEVPEYQVSDLSNSVEFGYAKLKSTNVLGETSDVYARLSFDPTGIENGIGNLNQFANLANDSDSYNDGIMTVNIDSLLPGYTYELEDVYVAYPKVNNELDSNQQPKVVTSIDGTSDYGYLSLSNGPGTFDSFESFFAWDTTQTELEDEIENELLSSVNNLFIRELQVRVEEFVNASYNDYLDLITTAPLISSISKEPNFMVIEEGRDAVTFQVDINEGTLKEDWNSEWTNGIDYSYNPDNLTLKANVWNDDSLLDSKVTEDELVELEFKDETWVDGQYKPWANSSLFEHYDDNLRDDNIRTHVYTIESISTSERELEANTNFDNLSFQFSETSPYDTTFSGKELSEIFVLMDLNSYYENTLSTNTISSLSDDPLFKTKQYNLPLIENTFRWYDVTPNEAKFSFSYIVDDEDTHTEGYLEFDDQHDIVLLWNEDGSTQSEVDETTGTSYDYNSYSISESYELDDAEGNGVGQNPGVLKYIGTEDATTQQPVATVSYSVSGLKSFTEYNNFAIYIKSSDSDWVLDDYSNKNGDFIIPVEDDRIFDISTAFGLKTPHDVVFYYFIIILLLLIILINAILFLVLKWIIWWNKHMRLSLYYDGSASFDQGELIINLLHVNKYPKLWNAHESDLILIAAGRTIDATFKRDSSLHNGYRIYVTEETTSKRTVLSIMSASKYNQYSIGVKGDHETFHATVLSDQKAKRITKLIAQTDLETYNKTRETILSDIAQKVEKDYGKKAKKTQVTDLVASISDAKTTAHSLRYQVLFPKDSNMLEKAGITDLSDPETSEKLKFFHLFHGHLYELEYKFIGKYGSLYEFDFINLDPASIYVGITVSLNKGIDMRPSAALYGVTKELDGTFPSKTDSHLGKPSSESSANPYPLWTEDDAREYLEDKALARAYDIITKKHYEDENIDNFMPLQRAHEYYEDYIVKWLNNAPEEKEKFIKKMNKKTAKKTVNKEDVVENDEVSTSPTTDEIEINLDKK